MRGVSTRISSQNSTNFNANFSQFDNMVDHKAKTEEFVAIKTINFLSASVAHSSTFTNENL